ncbi:MAG TPA: amidohydrolase family protein [Bryobacteraceae bacterium]|nr:amidohydrolase family protein [Bryobacteraceae bacterium]
MRAILLSSVLFLAAIAVLSSPQVKIWQTDPEWIQARYGEWGGPGVNPTPGPMDAVALKDWAPKPALVVQETSVPKARYPAIDVHAHVLARTPEQVQAWVRTMDEVGIETSVVLSGAIGEQFDKLVDLYLKPYPGRFQLYCGLDTRDVDKADYSERVVNELVRCYKKGARGVGELSDKGTGFGRSANVPRDRRLHPDDARLDAFWQKCAELNLPANIHVADHPSCWKPLDVYQERTPDYQHFNQYGKDVPSWEELIAIRDRTLAKHPKTRFIACHLGNQGHDLASLAKTLDRYPNLLVDISARDYEVGRTPRAAAKFLAKYRNRVLFGTDMGREKSMFQAWWRLFESADEFMPGRVWWRYSGLELPDPVLDAVYRGNAKRLLNWEKL